MIQNLLCHKLLQMTAVTAPTTEEADFGCQLCLRKRRYFHPGPSAAPSPRQWGQTDDITTFISTTTTLLHSPELLTTGPVLEGHVSKAKPRLQNLGGTSLNVLSSCTL